MSALEEVSFIGQRVSPRSAPLSVEEAAEVKEWFTRRLWTWILENGERKVTLRIWIFNKSWKIKDLHAVFELLLGPAPISVALG